jgi:hypothetical protein
MNFKIKFMQINILNADYQNTIINTFGEISIGYFTENYLVENLIACLMA